MKDWWKSPVLQGPENDYGDYDYMIEELPNNIAEWRFEKYGDLCNSCGKVRRLYFYNVSWFHTLDGGDYLDYTCCWKCMLEDKIWSIKNKIKKRVKTMKDTLSLYNTSKDRSWNCLKRYYELAKKINR